jgi:hypothetical protein
MAGCAEVGGVRGATRLEWVDWFNHRRLYQYCGDTSPAELEPTTTVTYQPGNQLNLKQN